MGMRRCHLLRRFQSHPHHLELLGIDMLLQHGEDLPFLALCVPHDCITKCREFLEELRVIDAQPFEFSQVLLGLSLLRQAGYDLGFTSVSGANGPATDPLQLRRYNVEPYSPRTFELVLRGACDLIAFKDTVAGTHARRVFNAALGTQTK